MKRAFRFRLLRVQRLRVAEEDLARADLLRTRTALAEAEAFRDRLAASLLNTRQERLVARQAKTFDPALDQLGEDLEHQLEVRIAGQATRVAAAQEEVETALSAYRERRQQREALDRLSDLALDRHKQALASADQAEADEASAARHARTKLP